MFGLKWSLRKILRLAVGAPPVSEPRLRFRQKREDKTMFDSITDTAGKLVATGYFIDP